MDRGTIIKGRQALEQISGVEWLYGSIAENNNQACFYCIAPQSVLQIDKLNGAQAIRTRTINAVAGLAKIPARKRDSIVRVGEASDGYVRLFIEEKTIGNLVNSVERDPERFNHQRLTNSQRGRLDVAGLSEEEIKHRVLQNTPEKRPDEQVDDFPEKQAFPSDREIIVDALSRLFPPATGHIWVAGPKSFRLMMNAQGAEETQAVKNVEDVLAPLGLELHRNSTSIEVAITDDNAEKLSAALANAPKPEPVIDIRKIIIQNNTHQTHPKRHMAEQVCSLLKNVTGVGWATSDHERVFTQYQSARTINKLATELEAHGVSGLEVKENELSLNVNKANLGILKEIKSALATDMATYLTQKTEIAWHASKDSTKVCSVSMSSEQARHINGRFGVDFTRMPESRTLELAVSKANLDLLQKSRAPWASLIRPPKAPAPTLGR